MSDRNVLGGELEPCGVDPLTGFYRDGCCRTGAEDLGSHTICAVATAEIPGAPASHRQRSHDSDAPVSLPGPRARRSMVCDSGELAACPLRRRGPAYVVLALLISGHSRSSRWLCFRSMP